MAKKKKSKKHSKAENKKYQAMTAEHLIELGNREIKSGNVRNAIMHYKQALKNRGNPSDLNILLFRAYLLREKQLSDKGMVKEADSIRLNALGFKPEAKALSEEDLSLCLNAFPLDEGIKLYNEYFVANGALPSAEKTIADKLLLSGDIDLLNGIHDDSALKTHCRDIQSAVYAMNGRHWEKALQDLKSIPRISPWSETKLFCKAMVSFLSDDDKTLTRSISQLSDTSPFSSTIRTLKLCADNTNWNFLSDNPVAGNLLFEGHNDVFPLIDTLTEQLETDSLSGARPVIQSLAAALYPGNPHETARSLMEIIWQNCRVQSDKPALYGELTKRLFPHKEAFLMNSKAMFNYGPNVFSSAFELSERLGELFSDERDIAVAKSEIFTYLATRLHDEEHLLHEDSEGLANMARMIGSEDFFSRYNNNEFCFSLVEHAVSVDPLNRAAYEMAETFQPLDIKQTRMEKFYQQMLVQFPDEPYPCLKLADIYDRKNAYRKAENILKEALKRAPQNNRVLERYAISFVIAAEKNMQSGKLHLVEADLSKADAFNLPAHTEIIAAKKLLLRSLQSNNTKPESLFADCVINFTNVQLFRIISLLICDMKSKKLKTETVKVTAYFTKALSKNLKQISSAERASLLMPVSDLHALAVSPFNIAELFILNEKKYLEGIDDDHFINLLATAGVIQKNILPQFKKSLKKRMKKAVGTDKTTLEFGYAAVKCIEGDEEMMSTLFELTDDAPSETLGRLRAISKALAPLAEGEIGDSLQKFDFDLFGPMGMMPDFFDSDDPFDHMGGDAANFEGGQILFTLFMSLERINKSSPRTAKMKLIREINMVAEMLDFDNIPYQVVVQARNALLGLMPMLKNSMRNFASLLDAALISELSEGAYTFLTGKHKPA